jgi:hypothetical protein
MEGSSEKVNKIIFMKGKMKETAMVSKIFNYKIAKAFSYCKN